LSEKISTLLDDLTLNSHLLVELVSNDPPKPDKENQKVNLIHEYYHCIE